MKAHRELVIRHAILVQDDDVQELLAYLARKYRTLEVSTRCSDGTVLEPETANALVKYENADFRRIVDLRLEAAGTPSVNNRSDGDESESEIKARARQRLDSLQEKLSIRVEGSILGSTRIEMRTEDHERIDVVVHELQQRFRAMKPWYSIVTRYDTNAVTFGIIASLVWIGTSVLTFLVTQRFFPRFASGFAPAGGFLLSWTVFRLMQWLFSKGSLRPWAAAWPFGEAT
jgi:hypothetical protein